MLLTLEFSCGLVLNCKNKVWSWQSARWVKEKWRVGPGILGVPPNRLNDKSKIKDTSALQKIPCVKQFKETRQGFKGLSTLFSGRKRKCWSFKEHVQNHLLKKQRKTSPQLMWNSHSHSWVIPGSLSLPLCFDFSWDVKAPRWVSLASGMLPSSLLPFWKLVSNSSSALQVPRNLSEHPRGVSLGRRAMSLHQRQRWGSCCQFSLLTSL